MLYGGLLESTSAGLALGFVLSYAMRDYVTPSNNLLWLSLFTGVYIARYAILKYQFKHHQEEYAKNLVIFRLGLVCSGLVWGLSGILLFPNEILYQKFLALTLVGVCGGSIITYAIDRYCVLIIPACIILLSTCSFTNSSSPFTTLILLNTMIFIAFVTLASIGVAKRLKESIFLRLTGEQARKEFSMLSQRQQLHIEHTPLAVIELDIALNITFWNAAATKMFGFTAEEALNQNISLILPKSKIEMFTDHMLKLMDGAAGAHMHSSNKTNHHGIIYCEWFNTVLKDEHGLVKRIAALIQDETAYVKARNKIEQLAYYDALTQLPNSRLLNNRIELAQAKSSRNKIFGGVIYIDIDNFKSINDTYGHAAGDRLLVSIASRFKKLLRSSDTASRRGGDEFIILLESIHDDEIVAMQHCVVVANKIIDTVNKPIELKHKIFSTTASIGISLFLDEKVSAEDLIRRADSAMYAAKQAGKNQFQFFDSDIQEKSEFKNKLKRDLKSAINKGQLELYFQPQVNEKHVVIGAEALLRWQHPKHGFIPPNEFIALSEETKQIVEIGDWVFNQACNQLEKWQLDEKSKHLTLSVNMSAVQFNQSDFVDSIMETLESSTCDPKLITIELTESATVDNFEDIILKMNKLKEAGLSFSLDDFGTGQSSLSVLKNLPLDELKIDQSFIRTLEEDDESGVIVQTIIAMGKSLSISIIAEGVETKEQAEILLESGCNNLQGYLFSKPVDSKAFKEFLNK